MAEKRDFTLSKNGDFSGRMRLRKMSINPNASIGMFDSGFGGLTVMRALTTTFPRENILYLGDTARLPYGDKSEQTVLCYAKENADFLLHLGIKILVVACATACSCALKALQASCPIPVIGVIPTTREGLSPLSKKCRIALLATPTTIRSGVYERRLKDLFPDAEIEPIACPLFVPLIEEGYIDHPLMYSAIHEYLQPVKQKGIDSILLGCTHYPLIAKEIQKEMGEKVTLLDPAWACVKKIGYLLNEKGARSTHGESPCYKFYVTNNPEKFRLIGKEFFGHSIKHLMHVEKSGDLCLK